MQIEETAGTPNKFIVLRKEVIEDTTLSLSEKLVYMRICTFDEYFESCEEAGKLLGISKVTVKRAKQKLLKLGYIRELTNTGRGKKYQPCYDLNVRQRDKICPSEGQNMSVRRTKYVRIDKIIEKKENIDDKSSIGDAVALEPVEKCDSYGNEEINAMFATWQEIFGIGQKQSQANRRACYNLLRKKDMGAEKLEKVLQILSEAQNDKYAPREVKQIVDFASLQRNMDHLGFWARRKFNQHRQTAEVEL